MPKTQVQTKKIKKERKREIALCGLRVFCEKGYDGTTVDDIVKKASCSHGLFYHYYKSKKEIFDEVMRIKREDSRIEMRDMLLKTPKYADKLRLILSNIFSELVDDENFPYYYYFFVSQSFALKEKGVPPPVKNIKRKPPVLLMEELFGEGQKCGEITDKYTPIECARLFISIIQGATIGYVIAPKEIQKKMKLPNIDFIIDIFLKGDAR